MAPEVTISELFDTYSDRLIIDVRSPGEFSAGHIPGAINIPLFTDDERAKVGTLYKQESPEAAMAEGLKIAGKKMASYLETVNRFINIEDIKITVHCWRGGKRSEAMQWLYRFTGIKAERLTGGYKSYRQACHQFFAEKNFDLRILGGYTGSGKTEILHELRLLNQQVVDLEQLAHHKGSAFGAIGENTQPSNEQFENNLFEAIRRLNPDQPIWLENESRNIGSVYLPEALWLKMRMAPLYHIDVDRDIRLDRALNYYASSTDLSLLRSSFEKIKKRLGGLEFQNAINALEGNDLRTAASIALTYYDKSYAYQIQHWDEEKVIRLGICNDVKEAAMRLRSKDQYERE